MRYLVTGGAGFIGSAVARRIAAAGHDVTVLDDLSAGRRENLPDTPPSGAPHKQDLNPPPGGGAPAPGGESRIHLQVGSITDPETVRAHARGAAGIFHLAAVASVQRSLDEPGYCHEVNVTGTLNVLEAARLERVPRVVLSSSAAIYGDAQTFPLTEDLPGAPISPYGLHKQVGEQYMRLYAHSGWVETVCLRYFNVFGPRQDPQSEYAAVVPRFVTTVLAGGTPRIFGDGRQSRDFLYVEDVAEANWRAMNTPEISGRVFNVCAGRETDLLDLVAMLGRITGRAITPRHEPAKPGDIRRSVGDDSRIRAALGIAAWTPVEEALARTVDWYRRQTTKT